MACAKSEVCEAQETCARISCAARALTEAWSGVGSASVVAPPSSASRRGMGICAQADACDQPAASSPRRESCELTPILQRSGLHQKRLHGKRLHQRGVQWRGVQIVCSILSREQRMLQHKPPRRAGTVGTGPSIASGGDGGGPGVDVAASCAGEGTRYGLRRVSVVRGVRERVGGREGRESSSERGEGAATLCGACMRG